MLPTLQRPALVIVDMQVGFASPGGAYARRGRTLRPRASILPVIGELRDEFRRRNLPRLYTAYRYRTDGSDYPGRLHALVPTAYAGRRRPDFVAGSPDVAIVPNLAPDASEPVIYKNRYSAFFGTVFKKRLDARRVRTLVLAGVLSHVCVAATARDAFSHDYEVVVVRDAVAGTEAALHAAMLREVEETLGCVASASEVIGALPPAGRFKPRSRSSLPRGK